MLHRIGGVTLSELTKAHPEAEHGGDRIRPAHAGDVGGRPVDRLEHRRVRPGGVDVAARRQAEAALHRRTEVGDDVPEQVVGHHHVEPFRAVDEVQAHRVRVHVGALHSRELALADLGEDPHPQVTGVVQHVGLVHHRQMAPARLCTGEGIADHTFHTVAGVDRLLRRHLVGQPLEQQPPGTGVHALGVLADDHHVTAVRRQPGDRRRDTRQELYRPQVDVLVEREAHLEQQATLQHARRHVGGPHRAEQDRVDLVELCEGLVGQDLPGGEVAAAAEVVVPAIGGEAEPSFGRVQRLQ